MTTGIDTDKYYTPTAVANLALERAQLANKPTICADTACGSGSLLDAAENVLEAKYCVGIDSDPLVIRQLRRARPDWRLFVGDFLKRHRAPPTDFPGVNCGVDLLVLNPPFSLGPKKYVSIKYSGRSVKCSVAMAHILRSLELFRPSQGAIAVVPESLLFSKTDHDARELLDQNFSLTELLQPSIYTFKGARVNSLVVQISAQDERTDFSIELTTAQSNAISTTVVRGGLQMHQFERRATGPRVVHSTSLKMIANGELDQISERTHTIAKGRISGWMLLLPRVGLPNADHFRAVYSKEYIQLSDCVIGMLFSSKSAASAAQRRVESNWQSLLSMYKGTGARYITLDRFVDWLYGVGIHDYVAMNEMSKISLLRTS